MFAKVDAVVLRQIAGCEIKCRFSNSATKPNEINHEKMPGRDS